MKAAGNKQLVELSNIPKISDDASLCFAQVKDQVPFLIRRIYYIFDAKTGEPRGHHAHYTTDQMMFCLRGRARVVLDNGFLRSEVWLDKPEKGLRLRPMIWHEMLDMSEETVLLVLASKEYDPGDYIRNYDQFKRLAREQHGRGQLVFNDFVKDIEEREAEYLNDIQRVLKSGWFILGNEVKAFEGELAEYLRVKRAVGVANGLEALQIALMALGIKEGDEVITTPLSAVATTLAIMAVGAKPVFTDVNDDGLMQVEMVETLITNKTKAILPVHLYGQPVNLGVLQTICAKHNLFLLEDACQAHGSQLDGRKLGSFGDMAAFSFYPTKNLGAFGDGGAIVTNNDGLAEKCRQIRDYGQSGKYKHAVYGLNSRLDELQAAILRTKLKYLDEDNARRRKIALIYGERLSGFKNLHLLGQDSWEGNNFHLMVIRSKRRDDLKEYLKEQGIPTLIHYPSTIPDQPVFAKKWGAGKIENARKIVGEVLSLPCHPQMTEDEVELVCRKIREFFADQSTIL